jgi:hypothetical protein
MKEIRFSPDGKWLAVKTMKGLQLLDGSHTVNATQLSKEKQNSTK